MRTAPSATSIFAVSPSTCCAFSAVAVQTCWSGVGVTTLVGAAQAAIRASDAKGVRMVRDLRLGEWASDAPSHVWPVRCCGMTQEEPMGALLLLTLICPLFPPLMLIAAVLAVMLGAL